MHYNLTIHNEDALPVPYVEQVENDGFNIRQLFIKQPLFVSAHCIHVGPKNQLIVTCRDKTKKLAFAPSPGLHFTIEPDLEADKI